jgi:hypothetical protein
MVVQFTFIFANNLLIWNFHLDDTDDDDYETENEEEVEEEVQEEGELVEIQDHKPCTSAKEIKTSEFRYNSIISMIM